MVADCVTVGPFNSNSEDVGESMVVCGKKKVAMPHSNTKKIKHREGSESEEEEEDITDPEEEDSSELEEGTSLDMPQEGLKISKLRCEEAKGRARVWWAFFCEPEYMRWCKPDAAPKPDVHALRKAGPWRGSPFSPALRLVRPIHKIRGLYYSSPMVIRGLLLPLKGRCMPQYGRALYRYHRTRSRARTHNAISQSAHSYAMQLWISCFSQLLHITCIQSSDEESESTALS